jgi:hypothetical protein
MPFLSIGDCAPGKTMNKRSAQSHTIRRNYPASDIHYLPSQNGHPISIAEDHLVQANIGNFGKDFPCHCNMVRPKISMDRGTRWKSTAMPFRLISFSAW